MTAEKYFEMQEQMGQPIEEDKIPPTMEDFPEEVEVAIETVSYTHLTLPTKA